MTYTRAMRPRRRGGYPARQRLTLALACLAALLNAVAPVLAYALGEPLHELASGRSVHGSMHHAAALLPSAHARAGAEVAAVAASSATIRDAAATGDMSAMADTDGMVAMGQMRGMDTTAVQRVDASAVAHPAQAGDGHARATGPRDGAHAEAPVAPHCPYCPDFAAGAALAPRGVVVPAPHVSPVNPAPVEARVVAARASLRLAPSRAPPLLA